MPFGNTKKPFDPSSLLLDDGRSYGGNIDPHQLQLLGMEQSRLRRGQLTAEQPGLMQPLGDQKWDSYFGLMQGRENAANAAGKDFNVDFAGRYGDSFGNNQYGKQDSPALRMLRRLGMRGAR